MSPQDLGAQVAVLKTELQHVRDDVADLKDDMKAVRDDVQSLKAGKATVLGLFALAAPFAGGILALVGQALMKKFGL